MTNATQLEPKLRRQLVPYFVYKKPRGNTLITLQLESWRPKDSANMLLCHLRGPLEAFWLVGITLFLMERFCTHPNLPSPSSLLQPTMQSNRNSLQHMVPVMVRKGNTLLIGSTVCTLNRKKTYCL
jgi:hypothetical protein